MYIHLKLLRILCKVLLRSDNENIPNNSIVEVKMIGHSNKNDKYRWPIVLKIVVC